MLISVLSPKLVVSPKLVSAKLVHVPETRAMG